MKKEEEKAEKAYKAIVYRIYPTEEQAIIFAKTFGCCRKVWNLMLQDKIDNHNATGFFGQQTPHMYKKEYPYLAEVDSLALSNEQLNLERAINDSFSKTRKNKVGFPKFKSAKNDKKSYTTNCVNNNIRIEDDKYIRLPKVGKVKAKIHRTAPKDWKLKSATITQKPDGKYYISLRYEYINDVEPVPISDNVLGLDYKSDGLYMDSNGQCLDMPKFYRDSQKKLAKAQKKLAHKKAGSKNYEKQKRKVAKISGHIARQRRDFLNKESAKIANSHDVVCVESLNMKAIGNKKRHNGKATFDNGYGLFTSMLKYKLADRGKYLVKIDKWYPSSQICSSCGKRKKLSLSDRIFKCECGLTIDRDYNAAINIRNEGLRMLISA